MIAEPVSVPSTGGGMSLSALLAPWVEIVAADDCAVHGMQIDSRQVASGYVFIALAGGLSHGVDFIDEVVAQGAVAILVDADDPAAASVPTEKYSVPVVAVPELARCAGAVVSRYYRDPSQDLQVVGVTGTDGKTSLCHLLGQALNENRNNCGVVGTLGIGFSDALVDAGLTTPDCVTLQKSLAAFRDAGANYAAMEVSSHALSQHRVSGIAFDVAVLTNLGRDHLDYHGDMQQYRAAKEALFYQPQLRAAVINSDDDFGNSLIGRLADLELTTYGVNPQAGQHVRFANVVQNHRGLEFELEFAGRQYGVSSGLFGDFNVSNLTAIFAVLVALGLSPELAANSIGQLRPVPGRMEVTRLDNGVTAIVDYAHNPHALESVLESISKHVDGRLTVVFGCGGDRDRGKRPLMAGIAEQYADRCIVTDDNPRHESGDEIISQIVAGFSATDRVFVERDRAQAIRVALAGAEAGDIVLIAGKGHEAYQLVGDQKLPFSDSEVVQVYAAGLAP
jgi:UDP-N-acetylmuramoyl-L-alanyl-D-glutamate--2,6-diaminopimelate ligase